MKYFVCESCNYKSLDKKNFNRHLKSKKHNNLVGQFRINKIKDNEEKEEIPEPKLFVCEFCLKKYAKKKIFETTSETILPKESNCRAGK